MIKAILRFVFKPVVLLILLILALGGSSAYMYDQWTKAKSEIASLKQNPNAAASKEVDTLIADVGKLIDLPKDEKPTVATVTDASKLKANNQQFFLKAENGDKVLIYPQAKKAILYRPSTNKVLDVAPVNIGNQAASFQAKFALLNGTDKTGLTNSFEKELKTKYPAIEVSSKVDAAKKDYAQSLIVAISEDQKKNVQTIADGLKLKVADKLPEGETAANGADFVIILGADR